MNYKKSKPLKVEVVGVSGKDVVVLKVAVELLAAHDIQVVLESDNAGGADITIADADTVHGQSFLNGSSAGEQALLVFSSENKPKEAGRTVLEKPIRVQDLKDALHDVCLACASKSAAVERTPAVISKPKSTEPQKVFDTSLLESLIESARDHALACYSVNSDLQLWVNGVNNTIAASCSMDKLEILGVVPSKSYSLKTVTDTEYSSAVNSQGMSVDNLRALLWKMAQKASRDQLLGGFSPDTPLKLKAWPNFTRNGASQKHIQLAALLSRSAKSLNSLQKHTGMDRAGLIGFCNAAYAMGLLEAEEIPSTLQFKGPKMPNRRSGLLNKLAQRLSFSTA